MPIGMSTPSAHPLTFDFCASCFAKKGFLWFARGDGHNGNAQSEDECHDAEAGADHAPAQDSREESECDEADHAKEGWNARGCTEEEVDEDAR